MSILKNAKVKIVINIILGLIIVIAFILNMVLLTTDVYKGCYKGDLPNSNTVEIYLYDNSYTYIELKNGQYQRYKVGLFEFIEASKYKQTPTSKDFSEDTIILLDSDNDRGYKYLQRKNVFCICGVYWENNDEVDVNYYCGMAIFLQVLYVLLEVIAIIILIIINKQKNVKKDDMRASQNSF